MNINQKEWRTKQIALTLLYRFFANVEISNSIVSWYDFDVNVNSVTGNYSFGVLVKTSTFNTTQAFENLVMELEQVNFDAISKKVPVLLMLVNESTEVAAVTCLVSWNYGSPRIHKLFRLIQLNDKNIPLISSAVKEMDNIIHVLDAPNIKITKKYQIRHKFDDGRFIIGDILYLRDFTDTYKMKPAKVESQKESFDRLLLGIPESEYPKDLLDDIVLSALEEKFGDCLHKTDTLLFTSDVKDLQKYVDYRMVPIEIRVFPSLDHVEPVVFESLKNYLTIRIIHLNLYCHSQKVEDYFKNNSIITYQLSLEEWISKMSELDRCLATLSSIQAVLR